MEKEINSEMSNKIVAIARMYKNQDFTIRLDEKHIVLKWKDAQPDQVSLIAAKKIKRKLVQVRQILGNNFMEFYWGGGRQMVYSHF